MVHVSIGGEFGLKSARCSAAGLVHTGHCLIYDITVDPSAAAWAIAISDGVATGTTKWSCKSALQVGFQYPFSKPMEMLTGIYAETVTNMTFTVLYAEVV